MLTAQSKGLLILHILSKLCPHFIEISVQVPRPRELFLTILSKVAHARHSGTPIPAAFHSKQLSLPDTNHMLIYVCVAHLPACWQTPQEQLFITMSLVPKKQGLVCCKCPVFTE